MSLKEVSGSSLPLQARRHVSKGQGHKLASMKSAQTDYSVHDILAKRWSPRAFAKQPIEKEKLLRLLEAARWAMSSYNEQPWRILIGQKPEPTYDELFACLGEFNQAWAKSAPALLLFVAKETFSRDDKPNRHAAHDIGAAGANLAVQATALGLYVHPVAGFSREEARTRFCIPEGFEPTVMYALGYLGNPDDLPENFRESELAERDRKPLSELVFGLKWGEPNVLVKP